MATAKLRRKSTGALGQHTLTGEYITKYNGNKPIKPSMLKKALSELSDIDDILQNVNCDGIVFGWRS